MVAFRDIGPPKSTIPGIAALDLLIFDSGDLRIWLGACYVYAESLTFDAHVFSTRAHPGTPVDRDDAWTLTVRFSDGKEATSATMSDVFNLVRKHEEPELPFLLREKGGTADIARWTETYWMAPLPLGGEMTFTIDFRDTRTSTTIDSRIILDAAARARSAWP